MSLVIIDTRRFDYLEVVATVINNVDDYKNFVDSAEDLLGKTRVNYYKSHTHGFIYPFLAYLEENRISNVLEINHFPVVGNYYGYEIKSYERTYLSDDGPVSYSEEVR